MFPASVKITILQYPNSSTEKPVSVDLNFFEAFLKNEVKDDILSY